MKWIMLPIALAAASLSPHAALAKEPKMTPMQLQSIQSREFEVTKSLLFGAVMTVIQDLGYTVESADLPSGFITAASPTENKTNFFGALAGQASSGNTVMTAFLMELPNGRTRVRLNFVNTKSTSSAYGRDSRKDKPILDPAVYNNAWERIDESLFVMGALEATDTKPAESVSTDTKEDSAAEAPEASRPPAEIKVGTPED